MSDFDKWVADNGLLMVKRFGDGRCAAIVPLLPGTFRMLIGPEMKGWVDDSY